MVDDGSTDETVDMLRKFNAVILPDVGSLSKAREIGIRNVETEWFYFIDDDNLIPQQFLEKMWKHPNEKIGMIYPNRVIPFDNWLVRYEEVVRRYRKAFGLKEVAEIRSYTGATLVRTRALSGINIPMIARYGDKR